METEEKNNETKRSKAKEDTVNESIFIHLTT